MINPRLPEMVRKAASQAAERAEAVDYGQLLERLWAVAQSPDLARNLTSARADHWAGAVPTWEPVDLRRKSQAEPAPVIGIDGSQIYPEGPVYWTYIQAVAHRRAETVSTLDQFIDIGHELANESDWAVELLENQEQLNSLVNTFRTMIEIRLAVQMCQMSPASLVLLDGDLLPWISVRGSSAGRYLQEYKNLLLASQLGQLAGLVSSPESGLLWRLIELGEGQHEKASFFTRPSDSAIMRHWLGVGDRSAIFRHGSPRNNIFSQAGAEIFFFFLRIDANEVVRIEVPEWAARNSEGIDRIQSSILADSRMTGYSYALTQAHRLGMIPMEIGKSLLVAARKEFWLRGILKQSAKEKMKKV